MARYNTVIPVNIITGAASQTYTLTAPREGQLTEFAGTAPYTVQLPNPAYFAGQSLALYNATSGSVTVSTSATSGSIVGASTNNSSSYALTSLTSSFLYSDGTNWASVGGGGGGPVNATTLSASSTVTLSPASANVAISPTGTGTVAISPAGALTINPTAASSINNTSVGTTTAAAGAFTTLSASSTVSGTGFSTYLASPPAIGGTAAAAGTFTTFTATGISTLAAVTEKIVPLSGATGTVTHDYSAAGVFYHTSISANFVPNFTNVPTTAARSVTVTLILNQGGTPYYPTSVQINGSAFSITWPGGVTPTPRASKYEFATFILINPAGSFNVVLGQYGSFG
jgi:hypothetical protein